MDARMGELQDALRVSESRLREALNNLDEYRAEVKSSIKREKKHAKIMHDKYKACKRERAQLEAEVDALRELASTPPPDATPGSVSYTRAAESAVKIASFAMEYPSPFAAFAVALFHALSWLFLRRGPSSVLAPPERFDVSGFLTVFP